MNPKHKHIKQAREMLVERPQGRIVVAFHRDGVLHLNGLVYY